MECVHLDGHVRPRVCYWRPAAPKSSGTDQKKIRGSRFPSLPFYWKKKRKQFRNERKFRSTTKGNCRRAAITRSPVRLTQQEQQRQQQQQPISSLSSQKMVASSTHTHSWYRRGGGGPGILWLLQIQSRKSLNTTNETDRENYKKAYGEIDRKKSLKRNSSSIQKWTVVGANRRGTLYSAWL